VFAYFPFHIYHPLDDDCPFIYIRNRIIVTTSTTIIIIHIIIGRVTNTVTATATHASTSTSTTTTTDMMIITTIHPQVTDIIITSTDRRRSSVP
jgi:hypothetical protein